MCLACSIRSLARPRHRRVGPVAGGVDEDMRAAPPLGAGASGRRRVDRCTVAVLLIQVVLVVASTRLVGMINASALALELAIVAVLAIALVITVLVTGGGAAENFTSRGVTESAPTISPSTAG